MRRNTLFLLKVGILLPILLFATDLFTVKSYNPEIFGNKTIDPPFIGYNSAWTDSILAKMTIDEKIAQLMMIPVYPQKDEEHFKKVEETIKKYKVGGIILFKGNAQSFVKLTNRFQSVSEIPLLTAVDGEWGPSMRVSDANKFPRQMMLGAIQDESLIYLMGREVARQCKRLGINVNFAPVIDINNNPANPVIGSRSFGEDKKNVASKGLAYMMGMQDEYILCTGKHFPGHGDTDKDSHKTLPVIPHSRTRLDTLEMFPFKKLINAGLTGIMVAHLYIPNLDSAKDVASSISYKIITKLLKDSIGFKGIVFTDALNMKGVSGYHEAGWIDLQAFKAGADVLLMPANVELGIKNIKKALKKGEITIEDIDKRVKKILMAKQWIGLDKYQPVSEKNVLKDINTDYAKLLNRKLIENSITIVKNQDSLLPFIKLDNTRFASVSIGSGHTTEFQKTLDLYTKFDHFSISKKASVEEFNKLMSKLKKYDYVIVAIQRTNQYPPRFGTTPQSIDFVEKLSTKTNVIPVIFTNAYALNLFKSDFQNNKAVVVAYQDSKETQNITAQVLFGGIPALGHLPVSTRTFPLNTGYKTKKIRLKYSTPEELNINKKELNRVDSIIKDAMGVGAIPGAQIMGIKDGIVFYHKSFGYFTYMEKHAVNNNDLYDIASVTKIIATMPVLMKLYEDKKFDINKKMSYYLPELKNTNKKDITVRDILTHQARLKPWIPFYLHTYTSRKHVNLKPYLYSPVRTDYFDTQVAENMFITSKYADTIYQEIYDSKLLRHKRYRYSDLGFYLIKKYLDSILPLSFDRYLYENYYHKLGSYKIVFNPLQQFGKDNVAPTENDIYFRHQLVQGYVHDYGAAMLGGVACHAGLFANANDLAKMLQMYLNGGEYGKIKFLNKSTIDFFTTRPKKNVHNNRRALGFDKKTFDGRGAVSNLASDKSYGHTGFTGTMVWVDPKYNFIFIFLSNRVYPSIENEKLIKMDIRRKIQTAFYRSFLKKDNMPINKNDISR